MNKSEIAERAAREISKTLRSRANTRWPVSHQQGWYEAANDVDTFAAAIVERAIAESQAPQPPEIVHLDCLKCGYYFEGWIDPPEVCPNDGTKLKPELGDGEPSPPPQELSFDQHADLLYSRNKWHMLCNGLSLDPAKSAVADVLKAVGGAAQEVSPRIISRETFPELGGETTVEVFEAVSPPSPDWAENWAKDFHDTYERTAPKFDYQTRQDSAVPWAEVPENNRKLMIAVCAEVLCRFEKWRGDTRELKAALKEMVWLNKSLQSKLVKAEDYNLIMERAEKLLG